MILIGRFIKKNGLIPSLCQVFGGRAIAEPVLSLSKSNHSPSVEKLHIPSLRLSRPSGLASYGGQAELRICSLKPWRRRIPNPFASIEASKKPSGEGFSVFVFLICTFLIINSTVFAEGPKLVQETQQKTAGREYRVRVLLQEIELGKPYEWKISSTSGIVIVDPQTKKKTRIDSKEISVVSKKNKFFINGVRFDQNKIYICSVKDHLKFEGKEYQGSLLLVADAHAYYLINSLDIEDYVCSVLRTESWPGWPLEVNKVFAIASRSYVIGVILNNKSSQLPYHVKNTNKHQTYSGVHANQVLKDAVDQTKGIFLTHDKKPIVAMFDSCCGGVIPAHIHGVNFNHAPYLARDYACTYCKGCRVYNWTAAYPIGHVENLFKKEHKHLKKIHHIRVAKTDKAGLVQQVSVKQGTRNFTLHGKRVYSLFDKVKSHCFDVNLEDQKIIFNGKGIGHHLGLCQWGAREMVRLGYDYKSILSFYYPGTNFMRLHG